MPRFFWCTPRRWAFTYDEAYHLLTSQLIVAGRTPYIDFCFPQTPLNAYWNAAWMRVLGESWHVPHFFAALFIIGAAGLIADYVGRRFPVREWRTAGAIAAMMAIGLNGAVFEYGPVQAYGICLFGVVAGFPLGGRRGRREKLASFWSGGAVRGRGCGVVPAFRRRCSGVVDLDDVLQSRRQPVEEVRCLRRGAIGPLHTGILAICPRTPPDVV